MQDTDFVIKQGWMKTKLHLSGPALEIYALVYGYTKDGKSWYEANIENIREWLGVSVRTVQYHLGFLVSAEYIIRQHSKYGRGSKIFLQVSQDILRRIEKGENFAPLKRVQKTTQKGATIAPFKAEKGANDDTTPIIRILINKDIKVFLLRAPAREEDEEKELFKIFFFRKAADPAAEVTAFLAWNQANSENWASTSSVKKYYFATKWKLGGQRAVNDRWLQAWSEVYNWAAVSEPEKAAMLIDPRFFGVRLNDGGARIFEQHVSAEVREWLLAHRDEVLTPIINPVAAGCRGEWRLV